MQRIRTNIMIIDIPQPISGGLMLSYKCNAGCRHCMYACSPDWNADWISNEALRNTLEGLAGKIAPSPFGDNYMSLNHGLHFSGGEPFLNFRLLCEAVETAHSLDIPSMFVETNCFWAASDEITLNKLKTLKELGLKGIMISVNPFYLEYVPFERTQRAIEKSLAVFGDNVMVYQIEYYRKFKELAIEGTMAFPDYLEDSGTRDFTSNTEFFISGRAAYCMSDYRMFPKYPAAAFFNIKCNPDFLRNWHNHFDNYGNYIPGYCGGLSLGSSFELDKTLNEGIDSANKPVLAYIVTNNFRDLLTFALDKGYREDQEGYLSKCHLCVDIRKHLAQNGDYIELQPVEFYERLN
jgi:hypothetical protein